MSHPDDAELDYYATLPERMAGKPMPRCPVCGGSEHERGCPEDAGDEEE